MRRVRLSRLTALPADRMMCSGGGWGRTSGGSIDLVTRQSLAPRRCGVHCGGAGGPPPLHPAAGAGAHHRGPRARGRSGATVHPLASLRGRYPPLSLSLSLSPLIRHFLTGRAAPRTRDPRKGAHLSQSLTVGLQHGGALEEEYPSWGGSRLLCIRLGIL
jgi:hypothetical protein